MRDWDMVSKWIFGIISVIAVCALIILLAIFLYG